MGKVPLIVEFLDDISKKHFGISRTEAKVPAICVFCKKPVESFRDELSRKEFKISSLCQSCQDEIFTEDV